MGYTLKDKHELHLGRASHLPEGDHCLAVSDYRREGQAMAYPA